MSILFYLFDFLDENSFIFLCKCHKKTKNINSVLRSLHSGSIYFAYCGRYEHTSSFWPPPQDVYKRQLNHSDRSITEIALDHGFPSAKSFAEAFKKNFQCPPKDYRSVIKIEPGLQTYHQNRQDIPVGHVLVDQKLQEYAAYNINCTNPPQTLTGNAPTEKLGEIKQALDGALEALEILMNE